MATCSGDLVSGDDLDAILTLLEEDFFENDDEMVEAITSSVDEIENLPTQKKIQCEICLKFYKSERGMKRHKSITHKGDKSNEDPVVPKLRLSHFKCFVERSAQKLLVEECYPDEILKEFKNFSFTSLDAEHSFKFIEGCVQSFDGDAEKFFPKFYKCVSQNAVFKNISRNASMVLGQEVANHVLSHLNDSSTFQEPGKLDEAAVNQFSDKEIAIVNYLSGYVLSTFYRRIRSSKKWNTIGSQQCLAILMAGKSDGEVVTREKNETLVNAKNRGGLWKIQPQVQDIFLIVESKFRYYTKHTVSKIDSKDLLSQLMMNSLVRANYSEICSKTENISKETALNLLEHLLLLYIRVRSFSFAKDKIKRHKQEVKKTKTKSLRTELKKKSNSDTKLDL